MANSSTLVISYKSGEFVNYILQGLIFLGLSKNFFNAPCAPNNWPTPSPIIEILDLPGTTPPNKKVSLDLLVQVYNNFFYNNNHIYTSKKLFTLHIKQWFFIFSISTIYRKIKYVFKFIHLYIFIYMNVFKQFT